MRIVRSGFRRIAALTRMPEPIVTIAFRNQARAYGIKFFRTASETLHSPRLIAGIYARPPAFWAAPRAWGRICSAGLICGRSGRTENRRHDSFMRQLARGALVQLRAHASSTRCCRSTRRHRTTPSRSGDPARPTPPSSWLAMLPTGVAGHSTAPDHTSCPAQTHRSDAPNRAASGHPWRRPRLPSTTTSLPIPAWRLPRASQLGEVQTSKREMATVIACSFSSEEANYATPCRANSRLNRRTRSLV